MAEPKKQTTQIVGTPISRVDGRAKVTGAAKYAADYPVQNLAHAVLVGSMIARGRVTGIDVAAAEGAPGVLAVITHEDQPVMHRVSLEHEPGRPGQTFLPL